MPREDMTLEIHIADFDEVQGAMREAKEKIESQRVEIGQITKQRDAAKLRADLIERRYLPCPDHRDKHQTGDRCMMCQIEQLRSIKTAASAVALNWCRERSDGGGIVVDHRRMRELEVALGLRKAETTKDAHIVRCLPGSDADAIAGDPETEQSSDEPGDEVHLGLGLSMSREQYDRIKHLLEKDSG